jgi:hypothetical protein
MMKAMKGGKGKALMARLEREHANKRWP